MHGSGSRAGSPDRRRRWHPDCVDAYQRSDPREARAWLRRRQRGICRACGLDTYRLRREIRALVRGRAKALRERGFLPRQSLWELDHIVPLIDGGSWERSNLQTLCVPCHRTKTAAEARERAARRRLGAEPAEPAAATEGGRRPGRAPAGRARPLAELLERADEANARVEQALAALERARARAR